MKTTAKRTKGSTVYNFIILLPSYFLCVTPFCACPLFCEIFVCFELGIAQLLLHLACIDLQMLIFVFAAHCRNQNTFVFIEGAKNSGTVGLHCHNKWIWSGQTKKKS